MNFIHHHRMQRTVILFFLLTVALHLSAEENLDALLADAKRVGSVAEALPILEKIHDQLEGGVPEEVAARVNLWLALADERARRWNQHLDDRTRTELDLLFQAHLQACQEAANAQSWTLARTAAARVRERIGGDDLGAAQVRKVAADVERSACQALGDKIGEGQAIILALREKHEVVFLGERRSETAARLQQRLILIAEARQLLGENSRLVLDDLELETRVYQPLPDRLPVLIPAMAYAEAQGKGQRLERHRDQALSDLETAVKEDVIRTWTVETRSMAQSLWQTRIKLADASASTDKASLRARALIDQLHTKQIARMLAGEPEEKGLPQEFINATRQLPPPSHSEDAAEAWLSLSIAAEAMAPEGKEWLEWARTAYAAQPGILVFSQKEWIHLPGSETATDWASRSIYRDEPVRRLCLQEAATAYEALGRQTGNWEPLALAEKCLRDAGLPGKGLLPTPDPASDASQGPDAAALDLVCHELAEVHEGSDPHPTLEKLLTLLHLTSKQLPSSQRRGGGEDIDLFEPNPYLGQLRGMTLTRLYWHTGVQATTDLCDAFNRHGLPEAIDIIGWLGGKNAEAAVAKLLPRLRQRPTDLGAWLPALQQGAPNSLSRLLEDVLPTLEDRELSFLAWRAGRCLHGTALDNVAQAILERGTGEILRSTFTWWASSHQHLDASLMLRLWQRVHHWNELRADLVTCLVATGDQRIPWWLMGVADDNNCDQFVRAQALNGLGLLNVAEGADLCVRLLSSEWNKPWMESAALLNAAALGRSKLAEDKALRWIKDIADDPEDDRVRAAHCLLLALNGTAEHQSWVESASNPFAARIVRDLCRTRLPGACTPALAMAKKALILWGKPGKSAYAERDWQARMDGLTRDASKLPLGEHQRLEWERLLGRSLPPPSPDAITSPSWKFAEHQPAPGLKAHSEVGH